MKKLENSFAVTCLNPYSTGTPNLTMVFENAAPMLYSLNPYSTGTPNLTNKCEYKVLIDLSS